MRKYIVTITGPQQYDEVTGRYTNTDQNFEVEAVDVKMIFDKGQYVNYLHLVDDKDRTVFVAPNFKMCRVLPDEDE